MASDPAATVCLSDKNLTKIPEDILQKCDYITVLNLSRNPYIQLHTYLRQFTHLRELDLSECDLTSIPEELCQLTELQELQLSRNPFAGEVNPAKGRLVQLRKLDLRNCGIHSLPDSVGNMQNLEELLLGNEYKESPPYFKSNRLSNSVISSIMRLTQLKKLHLRDCITTPVPDTIGDLQELQELDLSENYFSDGVPSAIARLVKLKKLDLRNCHIRSLPNGIFNLQQLEELNLCNNDYIDGIAHALQPLARLRKLDLSYCDLTNFPDSIGDLDQLQELDLSGNFFEEGVTSAIGQFKQLQKLDLQDCGIESLPDSILNLHQLRKLDLKGNFFDDGGLSAIVRLVHLKNLDLRMCNLRSLPETISNLLQLEELFLGNDEVCDNWNDFSTNGISPAIGRLTQLKNLNLSWCKITSLPDSIGDLKQLQELDLNGNNFSDGIPSAIWQLVQLKKLDLGNCKMKILPDAIYNLQHLLELDLNGNHFSDGVPSAIWQLVQLKKLDLRNCNIKSLSAAISNLQKLEELFLGNIVSEGFYGGYIKNENDFSIGISEAIAQLIRLQKLDLSNCNITNLPDIFGSLVQLTELQLEGNKIQDFPRCTLRLNNLRLLNLSAYITKYFIIETSDNETETSRNEEKGNCIVGLPIELASTSLLRLELHNNPITEPPPEIWKQGIKAIKSFMQALEPGRALMHADTLNMIGDTGAGKTSVAQSLVSRLPCTTDSSDRTRVLQQLRLPINERLGYSVNINDFGGHDIYRSVMPIFLSANGLVVIVFSLMDDNQEKKVKDWLLTAIAKCHEVRAIIVGTHADQVAGERSDLERKINQSLSNILKITTDEVDDHIIHLKKYDPNDKQVGSKMRCLQQLHDNLQKADISVVALSCLKSEDGRSNEGLSTLLNLVFKSLRLPRSLPIHWCSVMNGILNHNAVYIKMEHVEDICKVHFTDADNSEARVTILRYLSTTSQIIWLENHKSLNKIVFHSPLKIIELCKCILHHDSASLDQLKKNYGGKAVEEYENGILTELLLMKMLHSQTQKEGQRALPDDDLFNVVCHFLQEFNLIRCVTEESKDKKYIIPCKLSLSPPEQLEKFESIGRSCPNRVVVQLSFIGSLIPMSFFETSLLSMLAVAGHEYHRIWKNGLIIHRKNVYFIAKRLDPIITLSAFSELSDTSPWTLLDPIFKRLHDNVTWSWHGAPPHCVILCPSCLGRTQHENCVQNVGEIQSELIKLAEASRNGEKKEKCEQCTERDLLNVHTAQKRTDRKRSAMSSNKPSSSKRRKFSAPAPRTSPRSTTNSIGNVTSGGQFISFQADIININRPSNQAE